MRLALVASLSLSLAASCVVEDDGTVFVQGALPLDPADDCVAQADSEIFLSSGLLDILEPRGYTAALQVVTNLPSTFSGGEVNKDVNYPDYGATDNNIIIFSSAEIDFEFQVGAGDVAAVEGVQIDGAAVFACDGTTCTATGQKPAVSGTVFNEQTSLSSTAAVFLEAMSATDAVFFAEALAGVLQFPSDRARIIAKMRLKGTTTGNGELTTFTFPFPIDLCRGCLVPNADFCEGKGAVLVPNAAQDVCFLGQDHDAVAECRCGAAALGNEDCP